MDNGHRTTEHHRSETASLAGQAIVVLLAVVMVLATLVYGGVDTGMLAPLSLFSAAIVAVWGWHGVKAGKIPLSFNYLQLPIFALLVIGLIQLLPLRTAEIASGVLSVPASASLSLDPYATRFFIVRLVLYLIFLAAALTFVDTEGRLKSMSVTTVVFGSLMAFFGILQWLEKPGSIYGLRETPQAIPFGPFINQHHFAALMEMTGGLALGLLFGGAFKRNRTPFLVLAIVIMGMAVVFTGSRGGLLSFGGVIGFVLVASLIASRPEIPGEGEPGRVSSRLGMAAAGTALVLMIIGLVVFLGGGESLIRGTGLSSGVGDFTSGRSQFWQIAIRIFADHPFTGAGLDAFGAAFTRYDTASGLFRVEQAHNDYLQIMADAGIPGILCVLAFLYLLFSKGIKLISRSRSYLRRSVAIGALAGCFGIAIHSFFDFPLRTPANAYFFLMLSVLATVEVAERHSRRRHHRKEALSPRAQSNVLIGR